MLICWRRTKFGRYTTLKLDHLFCHFFINVRKKDGSEFKPNFLTSFQRSYGCHLHDLEKPYCLFNDKKFAKSRATYESKCEQLRQQGKGYRPNKSIGLNEGDMKILRSTKQFGEHCCPSRLAEIQHNT